MGLEVRHLRPISTSLFRFTRDNFKPLGYIQLTLTIGKFPKQHTFMLKLLVMDCPSTFNMILGRPSLKKIKGITLIHHLAMKFLIPEGSGQVYGKQKEEKECYNLSLWTIQKKKKKVRKVQNLVVQNMVMRPLDETLDPHIMDEGRKTGPIKKLVKIQVDEKELSRILKLGKNLNKEMHKEPHALLRNNLDVFT